MALFLPPASPRPRTEAALRFRLGGFRLRSALLVVLCALAFSACSTEGGDDEDGDGAPDTVPVGGSSNGILWVRGIISTLEGRPFTAEAPVRSVKLHVEPSRFFVHNQTAWFLENDSVFRAHTVAGRDTVADFLTRRTLKGSVVDLRKEAGQIWAVREPHQGRPLMLFRFNPETGFVQDSAAVAQVNAQYGDLAVDAAGLWVLVDNDFSLHRVEGIPLDTVKRIDLGEDPADPDGPRADKYGYGELAVLGKTGYVLDRYKKKIIKVDLAARVVVSVRPVPVFPDTALKPAFDDIITDGKNLLLVQDSPGALVRLDTATLTAVGPRWPAVSAEPTRLDDWAFQGNSLILLDSQGHLRELNPVTLAEKRRTPLPITFGEDLFAE